MNVLNKLVNWFKVMTWPRIPGAQQSRVGTTPPVTLTPTDDGRVETPAAEPMTLVAPAPRVPAPSKAALALIKAHEGLRLKAYVCPAGKWTVGYGQTGPSIGRGTVWSAAQAEAALAACVAQIHTELQSLVQVPLTQGQVDALVSFVYNFGATALATSTLLKHLNAGAYAAAAAEFPKWVKSKNPKTKTKEVLPGLVTRRAAERAMFEGQTP